MEEPIEMPKIKIDRTIIGPSYDTDRSDRNRLRDRKYEQNDEPIQLTQRQKDDRFDMFRIDIDDRRKQPDRKKRGRVRELPQLWFVASIIAAMGMFCIFSESIMINSMGMTYRLNSFEILLRASDVAVAMPSCTVYMSAIPLVFMVVFGLFAFLKENAFDKASLAMIAVLVFIVAVQLFWSGQLIRYGDGYLLTLTPGYGVLIEIGCAVALIIVIACQRIMDTVTSKRTAYSKW